MPVINSGLFTPMPPLRAFGTFLASILVVAGSLVVRAETLPANPEAPWRIAHFAADAGVHRRQVFHVAFETNNTAWFAVSDGLYRYDGYRWRHFTSADGLPSNFIRTVTVTREGAVWVGTDRGAGVFSGGTFDRRGTEGRLAGPNVRRIVEGPDGTLWFCCDRWPDTETRGGLTRWKDGVARNYGTSDGLPSDNLLNLMVRRDGTTLALTAGGIGVLIGDRWNPLEPAPPLEERTPWDLVEAPDGSLLLGVAGRVLRLWEGRWAECPGVTGEPRLSVGRDGNPLCIRVGSNGRGRFLRWSEDRFVGGSDGFDREGIEIESVAQAPDGAVWGVGRGTILRWENLPGRWQLLPDLPPPVAEDSAGRVWFADSGRAVVLEGSEAVAVPGLRAPLVADEQGGVWGNGDSNLVHWSEARLEVIPESVSGLAQVERGFTDGAGAVWFLGWNSADQTRLSFVKGTNWTQVRMASFEGRILSSVEPDPQSGVWAVATAADRSGFSVFRIQGAEPERLAIAEGGTGFSRPKIRVGNDRAFLFGYRRIWESPKTPPLHFRPSQTGEQVFDAAGSIGDVVAFLSQEGPDGSARVHVRRGADWLGHSIRYGQSFWLGKEGSLLVGDGSEIVLWQTREWSSPTYLGLPVDTTIRSMIRTGDGTLWIDTRLGVIRLNSLRMAPPETLVEGPSRFLEGSDARLMAWGLEAFAPQSHRRRFSFDRRVDSGPWSGYGDWPEAGLSLGTLAPGLHRMEVRARDGLGNEDPSPSRFEFEVLSPPIEDRRWFRPVLAGIGLGFAVLSAALFGVGRRLRRQSEGLEAQVRERTAELRADVASRRAAEQAALRLNERLSLALQAGRFGVWDWDAVSDKTTWDDSMYVLFGLDRTEFDGGREAWFSRILPEDRPKVEQDIRRSFEKHVDYVTRYRIRLPDGDIRHIAAEGFVRRDAGGRLVRVIGLNADVTEQETTREELVRREDRIRRLNECIARLVLEETGSGADPESLFRRLAERVSEAVQTARVGIWLLEEEGAVLRCVELFDSRTRRHDAGTRLATGNYPRYLAAIRQESRLSADEAFTDPRTSEFTKDYLEPQGITSMLDAAIQVGGKLAGVLCLEHVGPVRRWHPDEQGFISTVAAILAQTLETVERRRVETELLKNQSLLNATAELARVGGWELEITESGPGCLTWTDEVRRIHEVDAHFQLNLESAVQFYTPDARLQIAAAVRDAMELGKPYDLELTIVTARGRTIPVRSIGYAERRDGRVWRLVGAFQDISDRRLAEAALREERVRLARIIEGARVGTWEWNVQTGEAVFNERWAGLLGYTLAELQPVSIQTWNHLTHPDDVVRAEQILGQHFEHGTDYYECECRMRHKDGRWVWIQDRGRLITRDAEGRPLMMFGTHTDVTERRQAEEKQRGLQELLGRAERMESVGRLAGGVAHDFNNMLQAILGYTTLALLDAPSGTPLAENLEEIRRSAERSADLTRQLLAFARKQTAIPKVVDLNETISGMLKMLRRLIGENISLSWQPGAGLWPVTVDPGQMDQILANLCVNARDAIEGTGQITITTANMELDDSGVSGSPGIAPGPFVRITVEDTGHGMSPETLASIFEPFFTTKEVGRGTGLGLSTVFGIVSQNQGMIDVKSLPGAGTTFVIHLPRSHAALPEPVLEKRPVAVPAAETLMLVEDEDQVLRFTRQVLLRQGYTVLSASSPLAALEMASRHSGRIDLLVTDVVMPGMNGRQLHERLRVDHPALRCLYMSGYTADIIATHGVLQEGVAFLQKPFDVSQLVDRVREVLSGADPGRSV